MSYLIDTCVMSELVEKAPNPNVSQWFNQQPIEQLFLSSQYLRQSSESLRAINAFKIKVFTY